MLPQTSDKNLRLYKASKDNFPMKWTFFSEIADRPLADANIFYWNTSWWIIALYEPDYRISPDLYPEHRGFMRFLYVLFADAPLGPWHHHPNNCEMTATVGKLRFGVNMTCNVGSKNKNVASVASRVSQLPPSSSSPPSSSQSQQMRPHKVAGARSLRGIRPGGSVFSYEVFTEYRVVTL